MSNPTQLAVTALLLAGVTACSDQAVVTQPRMSASGSVSDASSIVSGGSDRVVSMMDACDHDSFAAVGVDCSRPGGVSFNELIAQLTAHQSAGAWHFSPSQMDAKVGLTLLAVNKGGEVHTFTRVAHFGGGIVDFLNGLVGTPVPAPECTALLSPGHDADFILPGGTDTDDVVQSGTSYYQCCIHPWMRTVVNGHS